MDLAAVQWVVAVIAGVCLITMVILRQADPEESSLHLWVIALSLLGLSNLLGAMRELLPEVPAIVIMNVTGAVGAIYLIQAVRVLIRLPRGPALQWPVAIAYAAFATWFTVVDPDAGVRLTIGSLFASAVFGYCAWLLWQHQEPGLRAVIRWSSLLCGIVAVAFALRASLYQVVDVPANYATATNPLFAATYIATGAMWTATTLMVAYVVARRIQLQLTEAKEAVEEANLRLLEMSWVDAATQVTNRSRIASLLSSGVASNAKFGVPLAVLLVSIEDSGNPTLDPRTVDPTMAAAADILRTSLGVQEPDFETMGRWGDDAFLVLLNGVTGSEAVQMADRVGASLLDESGQAGWDTCTVGVTECATGDSPEGILDRLYEATYAPGEQDRTVRFV